MKTKPQAHGDIMNHDHASDCDHVHGSTHPYRGASAPPSIEKLYPVCKDCMHPQHFTKCSSCSCARGGGTFLLFEIVRFGALLLAAAFSCQKLRTSDWFTGLAPIAALLALFVILRHVHRRKMRRGIEFSPDDIPNV
jgi:hypothetical protein